MTYQNIQFFVSRSNKKELSKSTSNFTTLFLPSGRKNKNIHFGCFFLSESWFIFQPVVTDRDFNDASWDLPVWMAIRTICTGTCSRCAGLMLRFSADFISKQFGQLLYGVYVCWNKQQQLFYDMFVENVMIKKRSTNSFEINVVSFCSNKKKTSI